MTEHYKDSPAGRAVRQKYADILHLSRPEPSRGHPRMSIQNRAKIFSPFAALRGYDDEIAAEDAALRRVTKTELSSEEKEKLSARLQHLRKNMQITVCYFEPEPSALAMLHGPAASETAPVSGSYRTVTGTVARIDRVCQELLLYTGGRNESGRELPHVISFDDILEISCGTVL